MPRLVHYHHPCDDTFSLLYSGGSPSDLDSSRSDADGPTKSLGYPFETPVYVLFEGTESAKTASDIDYDADFVQDRIENQSRPTQIVAFRLIELLKAAVNGREEDEFRLYKEFEPEQIHEALQNVSWGERLPTVAGELLSNLVLKHSLPNANHRTAIAMGQLCIETVEPAFEMPNTHIDDETWKEWIDSYIVESKRLITIRRNNLRFKHLAELNVDLVERKGGIRIRLSDYELDMYPGEAKQIYAKYHEDLCVDLVDELFDRTDQSDLSAQSGPTKQEFVEYLDSGVDIDSRELF